MTQAGTILLQDAIAGYQITWQDNAFEDYLIETFGCWLGLHEDNDATAQRLQAELSKISGAQRSYKYVAALGYLQAFVPSEPLEKMFRTALDWLMQRHTSFEGIPTGVLVDGVAMLGIALGTATMGENAFSNEVSGWAAKFLPNNIGYPELSSWQGLLMEAAARTLKIGNALPPCEKTNAAAFIVLSGKAVLQNVDNELVSLASSLTLEGLRQLPARQVELEYVALSIWAYRWIESNASALARPLTDISDVSRVLGRISQSLYRWTWEENPKTRKSEARKWHIDNEYHVQNLLWTILAPLFPDLKEEEYVDSVGQLQPRTDLVIPSLKLIIEAKFMYRRNAPREMIEQIAADSTLYLKPGSHYVRIIPVIWDDARRTEQHAMMIRGLKELRGIYDAIVISRPSEMV